MRSVCFLSVYVQLGGIHKHYAVRERMRVGYRWSRANQYGTCVWVNIPPAFLSEQTNFTISNGIVVPWKDLSFASSRSHVFRVPFVHSHIGENVRVSDISKMVFCDRHLPRSRGNSRV